jgi:PadR family transcriptional regulator PadR
MARTRNGPTLAELSLLGMLTEGPAHPYSVDSRVRAEGAPTEMAFSSIYAALSRLEKLGMVTSRPDEGARGKARRVYRLTPQGRTVLKTAARDALARPLSGGHPNDLGISNLTLLSKADALAAIAEARKTLQDTRQSREKTEAEYPGSVVALHRQMLHSAEERFYAELERVVGRVHHERGKRDE